MTRSKGTLKICPNRHKYYKSSSCPVCPICENELKPDEGFLADIVAPARRALKGAGITTLKQLSELTETELLKLHGMGPATIPKLRSALNSKGLSFKKVRGDHE